MDYTTKTRQELIAICKEKNIKGYIGKKKADILQLLMTPEKEVKCQWSRVWVRENKVIVPKTMCLSLWMKMEFVN